MSTKYFSLADVSEWIQLIGIYKDGFFTFDRREYIQEEALCQLRSDILCVLLGPKAVDFMPLSLVLKAQSAYDWRFKSIKKPAKERVKDTQTNRFLQIKIYRVAGGCYQPQAP